MASLHKNRRTTLERIEKFISRIYFTDVNLYGRIYPETCPAEVYHWALPQDKHWKVTTFKEIITQPFTSVSLGDCFGPTWATHWFKVVLKIPEAWTGKEVHLRWNSSSEALLFNQSGHPLQGFTGSPDHQKRQEYIISKSWNSKETDQDLVYYIEMSCNSMFGAGKGGMIDAPDPDRKYQLELADVAVCNTDAYKLLIDLELMHEIASELTKVETGGGDSRGYVALYTANQMINTIQAGDFDSAKRLSSQFFKQRNGDLAHVIDAMGHCHIDTAWLWPYDETIRKCARSWSSVLTLMKDYPQMTFVCSQAQQFSWVKEFYPSLYEDIKHQVISGRFIPVGGTWVEMDGNIPSGESFVRQFLYGQRFFEKEFGIKSKEFWLPDTFGYSAQIPQIMRHVGITRFLTQKLSWNLVNKFPHHNFWWEGIDGSTVLVHFPPGDSYEANCKVSEALKTERNLLDKGRAKRSVMLYGYGDGGGGPHKPMLDRLERLQDVDGVPKLLNSTPDQFFRALENEGANLCRWVGELYLELHNGTYTSQADMKKHNRICEYKLRNAELLFSIAFACGRIPFDEVSKIHDITREAWRLLLVNQFHDVLPGSSIELAHSEANVWFLKSQQLADDVIKSCISFLGGTVCSIQESNALLNTLPWSRDVLFYEGDVPTACGRLSPMSSKKYSLSLDTVVTFEKIKNGFKVMNQYFTVEIDLSGRITSMMHEKTGNQVFANTKFGNQLVLFDDIPLYWDAWDCMDYHLETRSLVNQACTTKEELHVAAFSPMKLTLKWSQSVGRSSQIIQMIHVSATNPYVEFETTVDWKENRKFLKVEFPVQVHAHQASFDSQFGFVVRPNHKNTSWDSARFEVCGHKWADLSEPTWGVAILNDSKYGWSVQGSTITLSLLRAPKAPDANCDMKSHHFRYAIMPHEGFPCKPDVVKQSYNFNCPPIPLRINNNNIDNSWFTIESESVVIETVKVSEPPLLCGNNSPLKKMLVVRLFESCGIRQRAKFSTSLPVVQIQECDGLEVPLLSQECIPLRTDNSYISADFNFTPFQLRSFLLILNIS